MMLDYHLDHSRREGAGHGLNDLP